MNVQIGGEGVPQGFTGLEMERYVGDFPGA